jgi:glycosyltransferase involved in cell wall biosynthesis
MPNKPLANFDQAAASLPLTSDDRIPTPGSSPAMPQASDPVTLSVVLPSYNHARFLPRALNALLAQSCPADEILIVDDASTDDSRAIAEEFARQFPTIRLICNERNVGAIHSLTRGLEAARGTYVYFAAADDWVLPDFFRVALDMLGQHPDAGLFCGEGRLEDGQSGKLLGIRPAARPRQTAGYVNPADVEALLQKTDYWILTGSAIFRRHNVIEAGGFDPTLASFADSYLSRKMVLRHGFIFAPRLVSTWCIFDNSLSRTAALNAPQAIHMLTTLRRRMQEDPAFPSWYARKFERRWRFSASRLALLADPINRSLLSAMSVHPKADRLVFDIVSRIAPRPTLRTAMLIWLWLQLRPVSLFALSRTIVGRYWK